MKNEIQIDSGMFCQLLRRELVKRCQKNPAYSLRAYAKTLGIDHGALSQILNGKRPVTLKMQNRLLDRLNIDWRQISRKLMAQSRKDSSQQKFLQISMDSFSVVADWYHMAILELLEVKGFQPTPQWIAKALGISAPEVQLALARLESVGLLIKKEDGAWVDQSAGFTTNINPKQTNSAKRQYQKQILKKSMESIDECPLELRNHSGMTMSISLKRLPEVKEMIREFRREVAELLKNDKEKDAVYQLGVSFFPLTQIQNHKGVPL